MDNWYRLDNAAKIFPAVTQASNTSVYRIAVLMHEPVDPALLQQAADAVIARFPLLAVKLRRGVFWNFFEENDARLLITEEENYPCSPLNPKYNHGYFLRVLYFKNRISIEVFHALTDGSGAFEFMKTLLYQYLRLKGKTIDPMDMILIPESVPERYETEDSFTRYYRPVKLDKQKNAKSFRIQGTLLEPYGNLVITGTMSASKLNRHAKEKGTTITGFVTAALIYSIYLNFLQYGLGTEQVVISVPVNLRNLFPSRTLRNFFAVANVGCTVNEQSTFDEILETVKSEMTEKLTHDYLNSKIAENVHLERNMAVKMVPLFLKNIVLKQAFILAGENLKTITLSNLGSLKLPPDIAKEVDRIEVVLYPTGKSPVNCGMCGYGDNLSITFTSTIREIGFLRQFFRFLTTSADLDIEIASNGWGTNTKK